MKTQAYSTGSLFNWALVRDAIRRTLKSVQGEEMTGGLVEKDKNIEITVLINDIFGGEILKTRHKKDWHFYNRIDGECIDLIREEADDSQNDSGLRSNPEITVTPANYIKQDDYTNFFLRFVIAFEEAVGLGKYQPA
ncbi:MAG: hypothetical protein RBT02_02410 [Bacteroidales bacterium]|jgi:hypothetical protein|nr:hypothetical protein [Bacteroidales bacterium]